MNDTWMKNQLTLWITVLGTLLLLYVFWMTKNLNLIVLIAAPILIYFSWIWSPKILMFTVYQLVLGVLVYFFVSQYWLPLISNAWDWVNGFVKVATYATVAGFSIWSIFSCFDDESLKETDLGHWSISGWLPKYSWAANLKNGPLGVFTGLPAFLVSIKKVPAEKLSRKIKPTIQVEIEGDSLNRKFAAVFDISFNYQAVDTFKALTSPSKPEDLEKIFEKSLTDWLNHKDNKYTDVKGLKEAIKEIQKKVEESLADAEDIYGKKMSEPRIIDIQLPEGIIQQQIDEAEEITDLEGFIEQAKKLKIPFPELKDKELADMILTLRGINKKVTFNTGGNSGGSKRGRGSSSPGVTPVVVIP